MYISFTGIAYSLLFFSLAFLTYRFFQYWQNSRDTTAKAFFCFALSLAFFAFVRMVTGLFFSVNIEILVNSTILANISQVLTAAIGVFIVMHIKFPKISPWLGFFVSFSLGAVSVIVTYMSAQSRLISYGMFGSINWGLSNIGFTYAFLRMAILLLAFIPIIIILMRQGQASRLIYLKKRSYGLAAALFLGIILGVLDYFVIEIIGYDAIIRDIIVSILSIFLFIVIFLTQKSPLEKAPNSI